MVRNFSSDYRLQLEDLIVSHDGIILTKYLADAGIPRSYLSIFVKEKKLKLVSRGIYCIPNKDIDKLFCLQANFSSVIFSHATALYLNDQTELFSNKIPEKISVTVKTGYNTKNLTAKNISVYSVNEKLFSLGKVNLCTAYGLEVQSFNIERTLCDLLRCKKRLEMSFVTESYKKWLSGKIVDIQLLKEYASLFGITNKVQNYLDIIL